MPDPARRPRLLLTRPAAAAAAFAKEAAALGFDPLIAPMAVYEDVPSAPLDTAGVQAVLLTSGHAAAVLARRTSDRSVPVLAVGDATARAARAAGFLDVTSAGGDGAALAALVRQRLDPSAGRLIHAAGAERAFDVAATAIADGFQAATHVLYRSRPAQAFNPAVLAALRGEEIDYAAFFSPRTAKTFAKLIATANLQGCLGRITAVSLSPAVETALGQLTWARRRTAAKPTAVALLATLAASMSDAAPEDGAGTRP